MEPRIRVSAILRWQGRVLLLRHDKAEGEAWLLPGGGVRWGESLISALQRELWEETGLFPAGAEVPLEGPVAIVDSISPPGAPYRKHVVHVIFAADVTGSLEEVASRDDAVRGHRTFHARELESITLHPPIQRFLQRWQPGDPATYLGEMWIP
ncbi:MAG TPA: NUDIX hydrolase [Gaiellaceae bacterium]|jgi:8-oxo-dGTP diphosphatase|nr:NUDIX hydrolase [Gaiellaceae bacterium]